MKIFLISGMIIFLMIHDCFGQVAINNTSLPPDNSAMLEIQSSSRGLLIPRLTEEQIRTITNPVNSLLVFCTTDDKFYAYISSSSTWKEVQFGAGTLTPTCGTPLLDARDGKTYNTVQIGTQCWMAQNLNTGTRINGSSNQSNNSVREKYCFGDLESNCDVYGGLYQWNEMMQFVTAPGTQGICPDDWHLPTDAEMNTLMTYAGGLDIAGGKLKEAGTVHWTSPNTGAVNEYGFNALPASFRDYLGNFSTPIGMRASFWTSNQNGSFAWDFTLEYNSDNAIHNSGAMKVNAFSVRCVKD